MENYQENRLQSILKASIELASTTNLSDLMEKMLQIAMNAVDSQHGTVYLIDNQKNEIYSYLMEGKHLQEIRNPLGRGISGYVAVTGKSIQLGNAYEDPRFDPTFDVLTGYNTRSIISIPLIRNEWPVGVLQIVSDESDKYNKEDVEYLEALASHMAIALENAQLFESQEKFIHENAALNKRLEQTSREIIKRLALAAERRDQDTGDHVERMAQYCQLLARFAGMTKQNCENIYFAAQMHDIGKIGIPDNILLKNGPLTAEEYRIMKKHTMMGADILLHSESEILRMAYEICLAHHEKWDGSGYPSGLKGTQISLVGRIAAIADAFDAITSRRVYKDAVSCGKAVQILRKDAGTHFDPDLVSLVENNYMDFQKICLFAVKNKED